MMQYSVLEKTMMRNHGQMLGEDLPARAYEIQDQLDTLYAAALKPDLSWRDQRDLDKRITDLECELEAILDNRAQAHTPGGYLTDTGVSPATGRVIGDPSLVLGAEGAGAKKKFPWWILILAAGATTYMTVRG